MLTTRRDRREGQGGQAIAVIAIALTVVLAAGAMVIDGGNAMAQQRGTQNGADSAALAGATVIAENMGGAGETDADVSTAVNNALGDNSTTGTSSYYVDYSYNIVGTIGRGGSIPDRAGGVQVGGARTFNTFLAGILGMNAWTAGAQATAMAGALRSICSPRTAAARCP